MPGITLIDCQTAGISGDMLLGALVDAGANVESIQEILELIPRYHHKCKSLRFETVDVTKHGFRSKAVHFAISEEPREIRAQELIQSAKDIAAASHLSGDARTVAIRSIEILADVESRLHNVEPSKVHLHEAGSTDTLADVFGVASACDSLGILLGEICSTPVAVGGGVISFSHGTVSAPAPAVLEIARRQGIPLIGGPAAEELATPTGIAILSVLARYFLETYPAMVPEKIGYGAGTKELENAPNLLRLVVGRTVPGNVNAEKILQLETNLDDVSGEMLGHALQRVLDSGAVDAWITPAVFKKTRPGHVLHAICKVDEAEKISDVVMRETGTLGVRFHAWNRFTLMRTVETVKLKIGEKYFDVRVKYARDRSGNIVRVKPEFEDIRTIAEELSIPARQVSDMVMREATQPQPKKNRV